MTINITPPAPEFNEFGQGMAYFHKNDTKNHTEASVILKWSEDHNLRIISVTPYVFPSAKVSICIFYERRDMATDMYDKLREADKLIETLKGNEALAESVIVPLIEHFKGAGWLGE